MTLKRRTAKVPGNGPSSHRLSSETNENGLARRMRGKDQNAAIRSRERGIPMFPLKSGKQEVSFRKRPHEVVQSNLILSCSSSGWNAKDDNERRAARCSPDRDGCRHYCGSGCTRRNLKPRNLADDLPRCFQRLLDRCTASAERVADCTDAPFIRKLVGGTGLRAMQGMADHDAPGIVPEAPR